jgi:DNA-binding response OmpR family regulator
VNASSHTSELVVALLSNDDKLAHIIDATIEAPWRLERHFYTGEMLDFLGLVGVRLVIVDDEPITEADRGWLLGQVRRNLDEAILLYVAGAHSVENERRARSNGAHYYTAKPIQADELKMVLKGFMDRLNK